MLASHRFLPHLVLAARTRMYWVAQVDTCAFPCSLRRRWVYAGQCRNFQDLDMQAEKRTLCHAAAEMRRWTPALRKKFSSTLASLLLCSCQGSSWRNEQPIRAGAEAITLRTRFSAFCASLLPSSAFAFYVAATHHGFSIIAQDHRAPALRRNLSSTLASLLASSERNHRFAVSMVLSHNWEHDSSDKVLRNRCASACLVRLCASSLKVLPACASRTAAKHCFTGRLGRKFIRHFFVQLRHYVHALHGRLPLGTNNHTHQTKAQDKRALNQWATMSWKKSTKRTSCCHVL